VFDGHGGEWCAAFMKERFENQLKTFLLDPEFGLFGSQTVGFNDCI